MYLWFLFLHKQLDNLQNLLNLIFVLLLDIFYSCMWLYYCNIADGVMHHALSMLKSRDKIPTLLWSSGAYILYGQQNWLGFLFCKCSLKHFSMLKILCSINNIWLCPLWIVVNSLCTRYAIVFVNKEDGFFFPLRKWMTLEL